MFYNKKREKLVVNTKKLVVTALLAALTTVSTMVIQIPLPFGYVNLGDMFVLLSAFVLGSWYGVISAGIGSALADIILGYAIYAPGTFVIKGLMAFVAGIIVKIFSHKCKSKIILYTIAGLVAEVIMVIGYFFYDAVILSYSWSALASVLGNLIQGAIGVVLAVMITKVLNYMQAFSESRTNMKNKNATNDNDKNQ